MAYMRVSARVVEREVHRMPARRKLWMKARWNSRKAIISGAEVISARLMVLTCYHLGQKNAAPSRARSFCAFRFDAGIP